MLDYLWKAKFLYQQISTKLYISHTILCECTSGQSFVYLRSVICVPQVSHLCTSGCVICVPQVSHLCTSGCVICVPQVSHLCISGQSFVYLRLCHLCTSRCVICVSQVVSFVYLRLCHLCTSGCVICVPQVVSFVYLMLCHLCTSGQYRVESEAVRSKVLSLDQMTIAKKIDSTSDKISRSVTKMKKSFKRLEID